MEPYWIRTGHKRLEPRIGTHGGGWRFLLSGGSGEESVTDVIADEAGEFRLTLAAARNEVSSRSFGEAPPPKEIRFDRNGGFYITS
jgi:hypothetical protein